MTDTQPAGCFSGLKVRILSGLVLAPLMVAIIFFGGYLFMGFMAIACLISFYEWFGLARAGAHPLFTLLIGAIYLAISFSSYIGLRFGFEAGAWLALAAIFCVWASDTGAYFTGKFIGGPKMAPKLSPKKTWAGLFGSVIFCGLMLVLFLYLEPEFEQFMPTNTGLDFGQSWLCVFLAGALLGIVGQIGDVSISFLKRRANLKDTGNIIPGHGGMLDRIDSLLLVAPVFLLMCLVFLK